MTSRDYELELSYLADNSDICFEQDRERMEALADDEAGEASAAA